MTGVPKANALSPDTLYDLACVMNDSQVAALAHAVKAMLEGSGYGTISINYWGGKPKDFSVQYFIRPIIEMADSDKPVDPQ